MDVCESCSMFFSPFAKENQAEVWPRFQSLLIWSFCFELKVLNESKYSVPWVRCAFGNVLKACVEYRPISRFFSNFDRQVFLHSIWNESTNSVNYRWCILFLLLFHEVMNLELSNRKLFCILWNCVNIIHWITGFVICCHKC